MRVPGRDGRRRRGSALIMAIWIVAVLSLMVLSFATEAHLQTGVNLYMRERVRVNHLTDAALQLAEVILLNYSGVSDPPEGQSDSDAAKEFEDDRWIGEKRELKKFNKVTIGPIALDEANPESSGNVLIEITMLGGGEQGGTKINVNTLWSGGNQHYKEWWEGIFLWAGIPDDFKDKDGNRLWDVLVDSWNDWRDDDDADSSECGAEAQYYKDEVNDKDELPENEWISPRNGEIADLKELANLRGFRDYPAVLTGGKLDPEDDDSPVVKRITDVLGTWGGTKVNVNLASEDVLMTIPGIGNRDGELEDGTVAAAIVEERETVAPDGKFSSDAEYGMFKDWNNLTMRVGFGSNGVGNEAQEFLTFGGEAAEGTQFQIRITGFSAGISHAIEAVAVVQDSEVRYIRWREDP